MTINEQGPIIPEWTRGDRFRNARELTGLDQAPFAALIGVSRGTVSSAENDGAVRKITVNAWAMATGVDKDWLLTGEGNARPTPPDGGQRDSDAALEALAAQKRSRAGHTRDSTPTGRYASAA